MIYDEEKNNSEKREKTLIQTWKNANAKITGIFVILVLAVYPLTFHDRYADILRFKYYCYFITVLILTAAMLVTAIFFLHRDAKWYDGKYAKQLKSSMHPRNWKAVDWAMIAFVGAAIISTFQSDYFYEAFWGNEGRYSGLFLILMYGISFFIVSNCLEYKRLYLDAFLMGGMICEIIGILHFFKIDPLKMKEGLSYGSYKIFLSTIGNVNTYTAYLAMLACVGVILFILEKKGKKKLFYLISALMSLLSMVTANSDNSYISLGVLFGLLPLYVFSSLKKAKQYVLIVAALFTEIFLIGWVTRLIPEHVMEIEGVFEIVSHFSGLPIIILFLWAGTIVLYKMDSKRERRGKVSGTCKTGKRIWLAILVLAVAAICLILVDANILGNGERYSSFSNYVVFDDEWGTHRGYIWKTAFECHRAFPLHHKLFGFGPDTFGIMTTRDYWDYWSDMGERYYELFENAHNEYIQYLITIGICGLVAYIAVLASALVKIVKRSFKDSEFMAIGFAIGCYAVQAAVNINVVIVVPIMLTLLMVGVSADKESPKLPESDY